MSFELHSQFQADVKLAIQLLIKKNGCDIKPTSMFVNLQLETLMTGNDRLMISSTF